MMVVFAGVLELVGVGVGEVITVVDRGDGEVVDEEGRKYR